MMGERCIDEKAIQTLQELGGASFVAEMIDVFLAFVPKIIGEARISLAEGNLEPVGRLGHTLRSNGRNLGAAKIVELAQSIESACREGRAGDLPVLLDQMEQAFLQVKDCLEELKKKL